MNASTKKMSSFWILAVFAVALHDKWQCESKSFIVSVQSTSFNCNENYATNCNSTFAKLDNGSYTWSMFADLVNPMYPNVTMHFQSYELKNGQYKKSMIHFEKSVCDFIKSDIWLLKMIKSFSNLPEKCPIPVGPFYIKDVIAREKSFPPGFPMSTWKFVFTFKIGAEEQSTLDIVFKMEQK